MQKLAKLLRNSVVGFLGLYLYNLLGFGLTMSLSVFNAVFIGLLGVPGFATLIILKAMGMAP